MRFFTTLATCVSRLLLITLTLPLVSLAQLPDIELTGIDGDKVRLNKFKGQVLLVVNTASACGYTPQFKELQELYLAYQSKGFTVLGFPSNDFGGQDPGADSEIKRFCTSKYGVTFPMFLKGRVVGEQKQPLYKFLTSSGDGTIQGEVDWNFEKFLIDRQGMVRFRFGSHVNPFNRRIKEALETLIKEKA